LLLRVQAMLVMLLLLGEIRIFGQGGRKGSPK